MNPVFAVPLYEAGMDPISVLFFRYLFGIPAIWLLMRLRGRTAAIGSRLVMRISLLGLLMVASSITLFLSYDAADIGVASTILFVYPLMVALIMVMFYHEILSFMSYLCMLGALAGVFLLSGTATGAVISLSAVILVLISALCYAVYIVLVNHKPFRSVATLSLTFWILVSGLVVLAAVVGIRGSLVCPTTGSMWFNSIMIAIVPTVISFLFTNMAIEKIGATPTAALGVFEPLTAVLFGVLLFNETLSLKGYIGIVLIMACTTVVITRRDITRRILAIRTLFPKAGRHHHRSKQSRRQ